MFPIATRKLGLATVVLAALAACSSPSTTTANNPGPTPNAEAGAPIDVPTTASIALEGDPNGLFWDAETSTLFIADDDNNRIVTYRDGVGTAKYADLPTAPADGPGLGQLVKLADGSILVTRFGFGTTGDIVQVKPDLTNTIIPNLDKEKRRIGLSVADDETIYVTHYVRRGAEQVGAIATLTLDGTEKDVITGLVKVVGVLASGDTLYVADQSQGKLYKAPRATPMSLEAIAELPSADLLCFGPNGSIFSGGSDGNVRAIDASGEVTVFATGFKATRGVAYDAANKRLFIANHEGTSGSNTIEIRPVP
jgi:hypothetical protein